MANEPARDANALQDKVSALKVLRHPDTFDMTQKEVADEAASASGELPVSIATISRFEHDPRSTRPIVGLEEAAIALLYHTRFGIARISLQWELKLRTADFKNEPLEYLILGAEQFVQEARALFASLDQLPAGAAAEPTELNLDRAALEALAQHLCLYRARSADPKLQRHLHTRSSNHGAKVCLYLKEALRASPNAERGDLILIAKSVLNSFFSAYCLDKLDDALSSLPRTRAFARMNSNSQLILTGFKAAIWSHDPRIAGYLAEHTVLAHSGFIPKAGPINVRVERPGSTLIESAARLVYLSKKLDGHETTPVRDWSPKWLSDHWLPELEPAIAFVEKDERKHATTT